MEASRVVDLVYLLCASQGLLVGAVLWSRAQNRAANRWLAVAIFTIAVSCVYTLYVRTGLYADYPHGLFAIDTLPALYGPLFYLYARSLTGSPIGKRAVVHFAPFAVYTLSALPRLLLAPAAKLAAFAEQERVGRSQLQALAALTIDLIGLAYLVAALLSVHGYRRALVGQYSNLDRIHLRWLSGLLSVLTVLWLGSMGGYIGQGSLLIYVHAGLALVIYVIAYLNIVQPQIFGGANVHAPVPVVDEVTDTKAASEEPAAASLPLKYQKTRLRDDQTQEIAQKLHTLFERERPYLNPEFTLTSLADMLGAAPHHVSQVLNEHFAQSFYDMVNSHRVEELKRRLLDPKLAYEKILGIGLDCGFSSKSTLNTNFKKHTGTTPREFRERAAARP